MAAKFPGGFAAKRDRTSYMSNGPPPALKPMPGLSAVVPLRGGSP